MRRKYGCDKGLEENKKEQEKNRTGMKKEKQEQGKNKKENMKRLGRPAEKR